MTPFEHAIEHLYAAFADVPKPRVIDGCAHCFDAQTRAELLATPLRDIAPDDLAPYASSALLTVGAVGDYLYFLPRILEVSAMDDSWWPDPEVTGSAIRETRPASWPASRLDAVTGVLGAIFHVAITSGEFHRIDPWLCAVARMGIDVQPFLRQVETSPAAVLAFFDDNASGLGEGRLDNAFWELPCPGHDAIVAWFHSDKVRKVPFDAYGFVMPR